MRKAAVCVSIVFVAMLIGAGTAGAKAGHAKRSAHALGVLIPKKGTILPRHGGTADSLNWSGYAVTPSAGNVTAVSSRFTVPPAGLVPPGVRRYLDRNRRLQHQRPDPGRDRRAVGARQPDRRAAVLRLV
jgi:hypothetical protein